jgi:hypothetical protein
LCRAGALSPKLDLIASGGSAVVDRAVGCARAASTMTESHKRKATALIDEDGTGAAAETGERKAKVARLSAQADAASVASSSSSSASAAAPSDGIPVADVWVGHYRLSFGHFRRPCRERG